MNQELQLLEKEHAAKCEAAFYEEILVPKTPEDFAHNERLSESIRQLEDRIAILKYQ